MQTVFFFAFLFFIRKRQITLVCSLNVSQITALLHLLNPTKPRNLLLVHRTGGGETHVTRVAGVIGRGIILIIIPLLF